MEAKARGLSCWDCIERSPWVWQRLVYVQSKNETGPFQSACGFQVAYFSALRTS